MRNRYFSMSVLFACKQSSNEVFHEERIPACHVTDNLTVDYLGKLNILDSKEDRSEYLLYGFQQQNYLRVNGEEELRVAKNHSKDGKDSFGDIMISFLYTDNDELLLVGMNGVCRYDMSFNLKEKTQFTDN